MFSLMTVFLEKQLNYTNFNPERCITITYMRKGQISTADSSVACQNVCQNKPLLNVRNTEEMFANMFIISNHRQVGAGVFFILCFLTLFLIVCVSCVLLASHLISNVVSTANGK